MINLTLDEAKKIAAEGDYKVIPISCEFFSDVKTPIEVLRILKNISRHVYMLESIEDNEKWGRYTFLGYDPKLELACLKGKMTIKNGTTIEMDIRHPGEMIKKILADYKSPKLEHLPPFTGGLVGYFAYDYICYAEPSLKLQAKDEENFKDVDLMLFDKVIAFDNYRQKIICIVNAKTEDIDRAYNKAVIELKNMTELIRSGQPQPPKQGRITSEFRPLFDKEAYCDMVRKAKHYIKEGDIFQVVLSNRLEADFEMAGASPETLVKLEDGVLHTFPLAGTRKRGRTEQEDLAFEKELLADEKERAEHNMLVDLGRNDIGKISAFGTVEVEKYMSIERFSHVMHIGSTVKGRIRSNLTALDAVDAVLPAGTLSGAPKLRACKIIDELEDNKRGIYGGAIGYLDFTGNLDTCIAIRLAFQKNGKVFVRSGAGIVADSVPENEYQECINKAAAVMDALKMAQGGDSL